jgi:predicted nucleotidyltransferase
VLTQDGFMSMEKWINREEVIERLKSNKEKYFKQFGVRLIGLFGSFARDEANEKSDIDILYEIEENKKLSLFAYLKLISELEKDFHAKIDLVRTATLKPQIKSYVYRDLVYV